jgi:hypothetical protein
MRALLPPYRHLYFGSLGVSFVLQMELGSAEDVAEREAAMQCAPPLRALHIPYISSCCV